MRVLVAYDSRTGNTRKVAERIGLVAQGTTPNVSVEPVTSLLPDEALRADVLFLGAWVDGLIFVGVGPSRNAIAWARSLPPLDGRLAATFCTFAINPRRSLARLTNLLSSKGAIVLGEHASRRNAVLRGVEPFARDVMGQVRMRLVPHPPSGPALR
jgi:hypothetical protein